MIEDENDQHNPPDDMQQNFKYQEELSYETTASDSDVLYIPSSDEKDVADEDDIQTAEEQAPEPFQMWRRIPTRTTSTFECVKC